jgi:pyruvate dehydrogenase E2 component (dihydrolipoamide acetyltransferase)
MATFTFKLPDIGEGVHEGEIVQWLVQPGDYVTEDQPLLEVMTDKVTAEIPSPVTGVITACHGKTGEVVAVGSVIVTLDTASEQPAEPSPPAVAAVEEPPELQTEPQVEATASTQNATLQNTTPQNTSNGKPHVSKAVLATPILATPATRKLARMLNVDIATVTGSGEHGRITSDDVRQATKTAPTTLTIPATTTTHMPATPAAEVSAPMFSLDAMPASVFVPPTISPQAVSPVSQVAAAQVSGPSVAVNPPLTPPLTANAAADTPFIGLRRKIAQHLTMAAQTAPHFGYVDEVDMTAIVDLRKQLKPRALHDGVKLNFLPFMVKAVCQALKAHPVLNSALNEAQGVIHHYPHINIGIAVATANGLVVPVIEHADQLNLQQLAQRIDVLATKARAGQLNLSEVQGGTFTLTSIGSIGGLFGMPIVNVPEVAIMGINSIKRRPVVRKDPHTHEEVIVIRDMMYLSLSCDHRVVDGADAAKFVNTVIHLLENPLLWLYNS